MPFLDVTDTIQALLTAEARNAEARAALGQIAYKFEGIALGRDGYNMLNPVKVVPFTDTPVQAEGWVDIIDNNFENGDRVILNGVPFAVDITSSGLLDWDKGADAEESANNLANAINGSANPLIRNIVGAVAVLNRIEITALNPGSQFNAITLAVDDLSIINFAISGATLTGGTSLWLGDHVWPTPPALAPTSIPFEQPNPKAVSMMLRVDRPDCLYGLGELGVIAKIIYSTNAFEIGHKFLFATARFPMKSKTDRDVFIFRIIVQY